MFHSFLTKPNTLSFTNKLSSRCTNTMLVMLTGGADKFIELCVGDSFCDVHCLIIAGFTKMSRVILLSLPTIFGVFFAPLSTVFHRTTTTHFCGQDDRFSTLRLFLVRHGDISYLFLQMVTTKTSTRMMGQKIEVSGLNFMSRFAWSSSLAILRRFLLVCSMKSTIPKSPAVLRSQAE